MCNKVSNLQYISNGMDTKKISSMMERSRFSRFRIPWLSAPTIPSPPRPATEIRNRAESTTVAVPIHRPPFRPPGIAPVQSRSTQAQSTSRVEPETRSSPTQPQSAPTLSDIKVESHVTSKTESPPREVTPSSRNSPKADVSFLPSSSKASSPGAAMSETMETQERKQLPETTLETTSQEAQPAINNTHSESPEKDLTLQESMKQEKTHIALIETVVPELPTAVIASGAETKEIKPIKEEAGDNEKKILTEKQNGIRENISKFVHKMVDGQSRQTMDDKLVGVVTLAGDNQGATMHVTSNPSKKEEPFHIYRGYKTNPDESPYVTTDGERNSRRGNKDSWNQEALPLTRAYVNSNTQGINNSIMFSSSIHERNPGAHLILPCKPAESMKSNDKPQVLETRKVEFNTTPSEKQTYQPVVRRRCLRGLLLESSDSDTENLKKPRRHGCRYNCTRTNKDKDIGIL